MITQYPLNRIQSVGFADTSALDSFGMNWHELTI